MKLLRLTEFLLLFALLPPAVAYLWMPLPVIPLLLPLFIYCLLVLLRDRAFDRSQLWNAQGFRLACRGIFIRFLAGALLLTATVLILDRAAFLSFVRQRPLLWALVMFLYPAVSVYPQEIVYRTFFFHRYRGLFSERGLIIASALAFGLMHVLFKNWIALLLTLAGGFLFARTYAKTRSTLAASMEHALYGCLIFTVGLGMYFYHGAVK